VLGGGVAALSVVALAVILLAGPFETDPSSQAGNARPGGGEDYVSPYLVLDVDVPLGESIFATASLLAAEMDVTVDVGRPRGGAPTIRVASSPSPEARGESVVDHWGAFVSFWGNVEAWDPASDETLYLPAERAEALAAMLGPVVDGGNVQLLSAQEIVVHLAGGGDGVGILPASSANPRMRSVVVEGVDLVRGIGDPASSPLAQRVWWSWDDDEVGPFAEKLVQRVNVAPPPVTRILLTGDIIPARCVYSRHRALDDYTAAFRDVGDALWAADIAVGSLDAPLSDVATPTACEQTFNLLAPARSVEGLSAAGFDVMTVATNHAKDCGSAGFVCNNRSFLDTLANLKGKGIAPVGGGVDLATARAPVVIERNGVRFAFLGYDDVSSSFYGATASLPGTATLSASNLIEDIAAAKAVADVVIVLPQWGTEYTPTPTSRQTDLARIAIEAGADIVAGNHPHVVQGVEWFEEGFVAYALGNFVFDQDWSVETQQGAVLEATFSGSRLISLRLVPVRIRDMYKPTWAEGAEAHSILERMRRSSEALPDREPVAGDKKVP